MDVCFALEFNSEFPEPSSSKLEMILIFVVIVALLLPILWPQRCFEVIQNQILDSFRFLLKTSLC